MQDQHQKGSKNSFQMIVLDAGERSDESGNHGLIYSVFSSFGDAGSKDSTPSKSVCQ
jgi:hypothetical protein